MAVQRGSHASWWFTAGGCAATVLYAVGIVPALAYAAIGVGSVVALALAVRRYGREARRAWLLLTWASMFFLAGALLRPWASVRHDGLRYAADSCSIPGYLFMIAGLAVLLYARRGLERHALIDGLIVFSAATLAATLLLALPTAAAPGRPVALSVIWAAYPLFDAVLVLLVVGLAFTTAVRQPAFVMLMLAMMLMFGGDLAYGITGISGDVSASPLLDVPYLLAFTMVGAFALHPSAATMGRVTPRPIQSWSWQRLLVICPALAAPFVLSVVMGPKSIVERTVLAVGGTVIVGLLLARAASAVRELAAAQRRYAHQANHDPLTGLPNRRMLSSAVDASLAHRRPAEGRELWMLYLDLDGFKLVNDSFGHSIGDRLITDVGARLGAVVPPGTTIARVGGDEFVVLAMSDEQDAIGLADRLMACLRQPFRIGGAEVLIGGSMGIAGTVGAAPASAESLMRDADTAMYRSKSTGHGGWTVFDTSMHEAVRERIEIEGALRVAVTREEFTLAYQPIVDLPSGHALGAEALIRWVHPVRGNIPPVVFIPVAEDTGLIASIGEWVLRRSIEQLAAWRRARLVDDDFWLSVNVSPRQLIDYGFPALVRETLTRHGVPARCVVLEITESILVENDTLPQTILRELRDLGVSVSVDDFGTGFSALGYLRRHPVTGVKIDRSFVSGLGASVEDEEIVRAVVAMSNALGLSIVAEGVETAVQRDVLAGLGVPLGQGWWWGKAIPPEEFTARWTAPAVTAVP